MPSTARTISGASDEEVARLKAALEASETALAESARRLADSDAEAARLRASFAEAERAVGSAQAQAGEVAASASAAHAIALAQIEAEAAAENSRLAAALAAAEASAEAAQRSAAEQARLAQEAAAAETVLSRRAAVAKAHSEHVAAGGSSEPSATADAAWAHNPTLQQVVSAALAERSQTGDSTSDFEGLSEDKGAAPLEELAPEDGVAATSAGSDADATRDKSMTRLASAGTLLTDAVSTAERSASALASEVCVLCAEYTRSSICLLLLQCFCSCSSLALGMMLAVPSRMMRCAWPSWRYANAHCSSPLLYHHPLCFLLFFRRRGASSGCHLDSCTTA